MTVVTNTERTLAANQFRNEYGKDALETYYQILRSQDSVRALAFAFFLAERAQGILRKNSKRPSVYQLMGLKGLETGGYDQNVMTPQQLLRKMNPASKEKTNLSKIFEQEVLKLGIVHYSKMEYINSMLETLLPLAKLSFENPYLFTYPTNLKKEHRNEIFDKHYQDALKFVDLQKMLVASYYKQSCLEPYNHYEDVMKLSKHSHAILTSFVVAQNAGNYLSRENILESCGMTRAEFKEALEELRDLGYISRKDGSPMRSTKVNTIGAIPPQKVFVDMKEKLQETTLVKFLREANDMQNTPEDEVESITEFPVRVSTPSQQEIDTSTPEGLITFLATTTRAFEVCYDSKGRIASVKVN